MLRKEQPDIPVIVLDAILAVSVAGTVAAAICWWPPRVPSFFDAAVVLIGIAWITRYRIRIAAQNSAWRNAILKSAKSGIDSEEPPEPPEPIMSRVPRKPPGQGPFTAHAQPPNDDAM